MENIEKIKLAYLNHIKEFGAKPISVLAFVKKIKMSEASFYEVFNTFDQIDETLWKGFVENTISKLENDEAYYQYSVREKLLAFYYTFIEELKENRTFVALGLATDEFKKFKEPKVLTYCKSAYKNYVGQLILEGKESNEVAERRFITERYPDAFWIQFLILMQFWLKDTSIDFEKTDSAIEKSVNASFDLIGASAFDSVIDAAKFFFQNR